MTILLGVAMAMLLGSGPVSAGSLKDIEHVIILMQENRSWNNVCCWKTPMIWSCILTSDIVMIVFWHHGWCTRFQWSQCASESGWIARLVPVSSPFLIDRIESWQNSVKECWFNLVQRHQDSSPLVSWLQRRKLDGCHPMFRSRR